MKKTLLFLGTIAVSAVTSGVTVWAVNRSQNDRIEYVEREVERTPALGSHFTAYEADKYPDLTYAAENAVKAVVNIEAIQQVDVPSGYGSGAYDPFFEFFGIPQQGYGRRGGQPQTQERRAGGSGVIISDDGYIVTNAHVVDGAQSISVVLPDSYNDTSSKSDDSKSSSDSSSDDGEDNLTYTATLVGKDTQTDIAVLKIDAKGLTAAEFGTSADLQVGEASIVIGNPLGFSLANSVTAGIISATDRTLTVEDRTMNLIQTDAAINSGNSGGPLVNSYGQVVGINSAKMTSTYSSASVEGLGFAIPITQAKDIIDDLINYGYVKGRPQLGITCIDIDEATASLYNMPVGTYVRSVTPNGAAALAGIQEGDIIIGVNGEAVSTTKELNEKKNEHNAGDSITLTISRNGKDMEVKVTLQEITQGDTLFGDQEAVEN